MTCQPQQDLPARPKLTTGVVCTAIDTNALLQDKVEHQKKIKQLKNRSSNLLNESANATSRLLRQPGASTQFERSIPDIQSIYLRDEALVRVGK